MQLDTRNPIAPVLVPYLMRQLMTSEYYADGQRLLVDWDFTQPADSAAAAYFNVVWRNVLRLIFHDQLPESLWPDGGDRWVAVVSNLLRQPDNQWWDDADTESVVEDRDQILTEAMHDARDELTRRMSVSPKKWTWGHLHRMDLENQSLGQDGLGVVRAIFNRGPFDVGGGTTSVDATGWNAVEGYDVTSAPSMRMVVDLDDLDRSRWVNLTGASGHVAVRALPRPDLVVGRGPDAAVGLRRGRGRAARPKTGWPWSRASLTDSAPRAFLGWAAGADSVRMRCAHRGFSFRNCRWSLVEFRYVAPVQQRRRRAGRHARTGARPGGDVVGCPRGWRADGRGGRGRGAEVDAGCARARRWPGSSRPAAR